MSTVKTNNVQIGQSVTATNNGTWYQPATPDGTIRYGIGNAGATTSDVVTLSSSGLSATALIPSGSTAPTNGMFLPTTNTLAWSTNSTERLRLDSSGNLGLGVTPSGWVSTFKAFQIGARGSVHAGSDASMRLAYNAFYDGTSYKRIAASSASQWIADTDGSFAWFQAGSSTAGSAISFTQAMTLESGGNLLLGTTTNSYSGLLVLSAASAVKNSIVQQDTGTTYGTNYYYTWFLNSTGGTAGSIAHTGATSVAYQTGSDRRLKKNIENSPAGLNKVNQMLVRAFAWKEDASHVDYGFIAQELYEIFPEAVAKGDDAIDIEDPKGIWQVEYGRLTPILVKAIQELSAELNLLKQKVNA